MRRSYPLHIKIFIGILLAFLVPLAHYATSEYYHFTSAQRVALALQWVAYLRPLNLAFIHALKLMAIPTVVTSLIVGMSGIESSVKLSYIGIRAVVLYMISTLFSVSLGLVIGNLFTPGAYLTAPLHLPAPPVKGAPAGGETLSWVPDNLFAALADNGNLLFLVLFAMLFSLCLLRIHARQRKHLFHLVEALNGVFIEMITTIMQVAPVGVFASVAVLLLELGTPEAILAYLKGAAVYVLCVLGGLAAMVFLVYALLVHLFSKVSWRCFLREMRPAQLLAFSTSSSVVALPLTLRCVEKGMKVSEEVANFVLPLGASINIDGTALYQGITVIFLAQAMFVPLDWMQQAGIVIYITISSLGLGGVPGSSLSSTSMLVQMLGLPPGVISLVLLPDRFLEMCRTATNVTGDAMVAVLVDKAEGEESPSDFAQGE